MLQRFLLTAAAVVLAACQGPEAPAPTPQLFASHHHGTVTHRRGGRLPRAELARVKRATERYRNLDRAVADSYADINVVLPNMGSHFLKATFLDGKFDAERPELLVYSPDKHGKLQLVAVEYAIPLDSSATAPEGFPGSADVWFPNQTFRLWTLHAWIWKENPDGVFNATNKRVP
jgi:hypothetical protein